MNEYNKRAMKRACIFLGTLIITLTLFSAYASAEIMIVDGTNPNEDSSPPSDGNYTDPTIDYIECPEGYDCIREGDYNQFIASLQILAERFELKADFLEAILERFDKKMDLDSDTIDKLTSLATKSEENTERTLHDFAEYVRNTDLKVERVNKNNKTLEIQLNELKAGEFWRMLLIVILVFGAFLIYERLKPHSMFIWDKFVAWFPVKI